MSIRTGILLALGLAVSAAAQTPAPPTADVLGAWDVMFATQQGQIPGSLTLKKDGEKIVGTLSSQTGEVPVEAEIKGPDLTVWFTFEGQNGPIDIEMHGKVDGDKIAGGLTFASQPGGTWSATRKGKESKEAKESKDPSAAPSPPSSPSIPSLTGSWNVTVELPNMTANPTLVLKQDGEKLTGEYVSAQYGKFPVTGTIKGADVRFQFAMSVEGNALDVTYTATVEKDGTLKGSVTYGDMMSGTFVASKQK